MSTPNLDAMGHQWVGALHSSTLNWSIKKGMITWWQMYLAKLPLDWIQKQWNPSSMESLGNGPSGWSQWPCHTWGWSMLGTRGTCCHRLCTCRNACYWLGWSPDRRPNVEHSVGLAEGTETDRLEGTSGRTHLQWRRQSNPMELAELCDSSAGLVPALNAQRWDWRSPTLCGPIGPSYCHFEWVQPRCRSSEVWPYLVFVAEALLVAMYGQWDAAVYQVLHALLAAQGQFVQSTPMPNCGHCSDWPLACRLYQHRKWPWSWIDCPRLQMSWCSRTISQNT